MRVERVEVGERTLELVLRAEPGEPLRTAALPELPAAALRLLPGLGKHRCENDAGRPFIVELADTETGHLFEHLVLEIMALAGSPRGLEAHTSWDFRHDERGVFRVSVAFDNDLVALGAVRLADSVLRHLLGGGGAPEVAAEVDRLRRLRSG